MSIGCRPLPSRSDRLLRWRIWRTELQRVAKGEEIVVTRYDKPVARIIPAGGRDLRDVRQAVDSLIALRGAIAEWRGSGVGLDHAEIKAMIEEGRR